MHRIETIPAAINTDDAWALARTLTDAKAERLTDMVFEQGEVSLQDAVNALNVHSDAIYDAGYEIVVVRGSAYIVGFGF